MGGEAAVGCSLLYELRDGYMEEIARYTALLYNCEARRALLHMELFGEEPKPTDETLIDELEGRIALYRFLLENAVVMLATAEHTIWEKMNDGATDAGIGCQDATPGDAAHAAPGV